MKPWQNKKHVCLECVWMHQSDVYVVRLTLQAISVNILTEYERGYKRTGLVVGSSCTMSGMQVTSYSSRPFIISS